MARASVVLAVLLVVSSCGTTLELGLDDLPDPSAVPPATPGPTPSSPPELSGEPPDEPTVTPAEQATPTATPMPRPRLSYDDAIDAYFADVERFWSGPAGAELGIDFTPVRARVPYDPGDVDSIPPCDGQIGVLEIYSGNAFYCEPDDYIAWDDVTLFPELYRVYGDISVGLVIAHEYAHAVQRQAALDGRTIFLELQADCLAGAWAASVAAGDAPALSFGRGDLDDAIGGFLTFADPLGTPAANPAAHGTAFDRLNAFAEGFEGGVTSCPAFLTDPPQTAAIVVDRFDENEGNLPLDQLLPLLVDDLRVYLDRLGEELVSPSFDAPGELMELPADVASPPICDRVEVVGDVAGSAFFCELDGEVYADRSELDAAWSAVGDFAPAYAVAHAYSTAVAVELTTGAAAVVTGADCLVGVWARSIFDDARLPPDERSHQIFLSAGDLDEGIVGLLLGEAAGPSLAPVGQVKTFDRVAAFGQGFFRGSAACNLA